MKTANEVIGEFETTQLTGGQLAVRAAFQQVMMEASRLASNGLQARGLDEETATLCVAQYLVRWAACLMGTAAHLGGHDRETSSQMWLAHCEIEFNESMDMLAANPIAPLADKGDGDGDVTDR